MFYPQCKENTMAQTAIDRLKVARQCTRGWVHIDGPVKSPRGRIAVLFRTDFPLTASDLAKVNRLADAFPTQIEDVVNMTATGFALTYKLNISMETSAVNAEAVSDRWIKWSDTENPSVIEIGLHSTKR